MTTNTPLDPQPDPEGAPEPGEGSRPAAPCAESPALAPEPARSALPAPQAAEPLARPPEPPTAEPRGSAPASGGVRCAQCEADVVPTTPNHCPQCGGWVFDNTGSLVHGLRSKRLARVVDAYRVDLIAQLFAERGGRDALDVVGRIAIENFALVCAQHKTIEARLDQDGLFTQTGRRRSAFDMLKSISETIDRLRAELPPPIARESTAISLLSTEQLIEKTTAILTSLLEESDEHLLPPLDAERDDTARDTDRAAGPSVMAEGGTDEELLKPTPVLAPESVCAYCRRACVGPDHIAYEVLHWSDPIEVARRQKEATAVMYRMVGEGITWHR